MILTTTLLTFFIAFILVTKYLYAFSWEQYQAAVHEKLFHLVLCVNLTIILLINWIPGSTPFYLLPVFHQSSPYRCTTKSFNYKE